MTIRDGFSDADRADHRIKVSRRVTRNLLERAIAGELKAIKEFHGRVEGKSPKGKRVEQPTKTIIKWMDPIK